MSEISMKIKRLMVSSFLDGHTIAEVARNNKLSQEKASKIIKSSIGEDRYEQQKKKNKRAGLLRFNKQLRDNGITHPGCGEKVRNDFCVPLTHTPSPMEVARKVLRGRLKERHGEFILDDRASNLTEIMKATNRRLLLRGQKQIDVNSAWVVSTHG